MIEEFKTVEAFEIFFKLYYAATVRYCTAIVGDNDDSKDIVQKVFISLWRKREKIVITISARAYLYKAVYNASLDFIKHQKVRKKFLDEFKPGSAIAIYQDNITNKELHLRIEKAISQLPEQCSRIFIMSRDQNLKYREIAAQLGISEKTVENQMSKALRLIRESLKKYMNSIIILINLFS